MKKQSAKTLLLVEPKDIYTVTKTGSVYLGEFPVTKDELKTLQEEIKYLEKTRIWSILVNTVSDKAKEIMFEKSETFEDMRTGKAMLLNIRQMKKILTELKSILI
jgi:hypothetical protein